MADLDIKLTVVGGEQFQKAINDAAEGVKETIKDAISDLRDEIESTTTTLVPVRTGALRDSIDIAIQDDGFSIRAQATMDYASFVDQGTRKMEAEPYFEQPINDAFEDFEDELEDRIATSLQDT